MKKTREFFAPIAYRSKRKTSTFQHSNENRSNVENQASLRLIATYTFMYIV